MTYSSSFFGNLTAATVLMITLATLILGQVLAYAYGYVASGYVAPAEYIKLGWAMQIVFYLIAAYIPIRSVLQASTGGNIGYQMKYIIVIAIFAFMIGLFLEPISTGLFHIQVFSVVDMNLQPFAVVGLP